MRDRTPVQMPTLFSQGETEGQSQSPHNEHAYEHIAVVGSVGHVLMPVSLFSSPQEEVRLSELQPQLHQLVDVVEPQEVRVRPRAEIRLPVVPLQSQEDGDTENTHFLPAHVQGTPALRMFPRQNTILKLF